MWCWEDVVGSDLKDAEVQSRFETRRLVRQVQRSTSCNEILLVCAPNPRTWCIGYWHNATKYPVSFVTFQLSLIQTCYLNKPSINFFPSHNNNNPLQIYKLLFNKKTFTRCLKTCALVALNRTKRLMARLNSGHSEYEFLSSLNVTVRYEVLRGSKRTWVTVPRGRPIEPNSHGSGYPVEKI